MKVAIVGDVHLTLRKYKEFEENRFKLLIDELIKAKPSVVVFAGDLLDHARPSIEELGVLFTALVKIESNGIKINIIDGNHEALSSNTSVYDHLMIGDSRYIKNMYLPTHPSIKCIGWTSVKETNHLDFDEILITHLRANHGLIKEEFNIESLSKNYKQVFMGDLHFRYSPYNNVHYTSSPYSTKFTDKTLSDYGYIMLQTEDYTWEYIDLELPCKVKRNCNAKDINQVIKGLDKHLIRLEVSGTLEELQNLPSIDNVIYIKNIQQTSNTTNTVINKNDLIKDLEEHIIESGFITKYPDSNKKIVSILQEIKG